MDRTAQFVHRYVTSLMMVSVCVECECVIGFSPRAEILAIVEKLHICKKMPEDIAASFRPEERKTA